MIGVKINDKFLKMNPGTRVSLEFNNPVFDDTIIRGSYSLPLDVPYRGNGKTFSFGYETLMQARTQ